MVCRCKLKRVFSFRCLDTNPTSVVYERIAMCSDVLELIPVVFLLPSVLANTKNSSGGDDEERKSDSQVLYQIFPGRVEEQQLICFYRGDVIDA